VTPEGKQNAAAEARSTHAGSTCMLLQRMEVKEGGGGKGGSRACMTRAHVRRGCGGVSQRTMPVGMAIHGSASGRAGARRGLRDRE
jgi:hypothetical protein